MDGKMQCLYVSSFMEIFWTDFLEEGPDGVIAPLVETGGWGVIGRLRGKKAFDLLTPQIPMPLLPRLLPFIRIKWGGKKYG